MLGDIFACQGLSYSVAGRGVLKAFYTGDGKGGLIISLDRVHTKGVMQQHAS